MPGRTSVRASRASQGKTVSAKSSTQTLKTRSTRASALAVDIPDEGPSTSLREQICSVFADAQRSTATQRKLATSLRKIQEACCYEPVKARKKKQQQYEEEFGEQEFNEEVGRCLIRVLPVKKSENVGDKTIRFVGLFLKLASEKDNTIARGDDEITDVFFDTPTSRLTSHIISLLIPLLTAKDKTVRFRATQIIAHLINTLDSIDDDSFQLVRLGLLKRLRDKESAVRAQAVLGLGRLADEGAEDDDENDSDDDDAGGVLERLLDVLQNDPAADVRRALLLNLPFAPSTLPYLLERARDSDPATRRALYGRLLPALGDFRHLSLTHREKLLRWGLRDRDEAVRKATARLFRERWIEDCASSHQTEEMEVEGEKPEGQIAQPSLDALLELLERIDIVNSGVETGIAGTAMAEFWAGRPDYLEHISFPPDFWENLTPESIFVARTFNDYCLSAPDERTREICSDKMPEVTGYAFLLQKHLRILVEGVQRVALNTDPDAEEDTVAQEFCVEQMLNIALTLDYSDEVGRRTMFSIMREALALAELPEECTRLVIEVLRTVSSGIGAEGEKEFCGIVLEAISEVHDTIMGDNDAATEGAEEEDSFHSARSELSDESTPKKKKGRKHSQTEEMDEEERAIREIMVNLKCLHIAQCMLQNVQCDLESNSHMVTMLNNLIVPAVRSQEAPIREKGLLCLGLCCLLSKNLATENLTLFLHCFSKGHEALQQIALQTISDILITHPSLLQPTTSNTTINAEDATEAESQPNPLIKPVHKLYSRALASPSVPLAATATVALSKMLLTQILPYPDDLLKALTLAFFDPETASNAGMRQALSYFLPVYCHSRAENAVRMARQAVAIVSAVVERVEEEEVDLDGGKDGVGAVVVGGMIVDWCDPRKAVGADEVSSQSKTQEAEDSPNAHAVLAEEILERLLTPGTNKEARKPLISMLSKLHIAPSTPATTLTTLSELLTEAAESKLASETTSRNAITKLSNSVEKLLATAAESAEQTQLPDRTVVEAVERPESQATASRATSRAASPNESVAESVAESIVKVEKADAVEASEVDDTIDDSIDLGEADAEGTILPDDDDEDTIHVGGKSLTQIEEEDEDEDEVDEDTIVVGGRRPRQKRSVRLTEESLVDSLLDEDGDTIMD